MSMTVVSSSASEYLEVGYLVNASSAGFAQEYADAIAGGFKPDGGNPVWDGSNWVAFMRRVNKYK